MNIRIIYALWKIKEDTGKYVSIIREYTDLTKYFVDHDRSGFLIAYYFTEKTLCLNI